MNKLFLSGLVLLVSLNSWAQFAINPVNWPTPSGGLINNSNLLGYDFTTGVAVTAQTNSSQSWSLVDMNGDGKPDLVVTAALGANGATEFNATTSPSWKVYLNTGAAFSTSAITWSTPQGGTISSNNLLGFNNTNGLAVAGQSTGSQSWSLVDMNGDGKPDLVVTGALGTNGNTQFNASTTPDWQVYLNTGSGFSATGNTWLTPQGGNITSNNLLGYNNVSGTAVTGQSTGSQSWSLVDINGDGKPDLVVAAALGANGATQFNVTTTPDWQVYLNTGTGFSSTATTWSTPQGGNITSSNLLGYNGTSGTAATGQTLTSQSWSLLDLNGDNKPDLVVTAALGANGATQFAPTTTPNWQVYLNTGSGFAAVATTWSTPQGGLLTSNNLLGFNAIAGTAAAGQTVNSQTWIVNDLNGDGKPDLVVIASYGVQGPTEWSATSSPYWEVYQNTGTGFSASVKYWFTPTGGQLINHQYLGYNAASSIASGAENNTSASWALVDLDGTGFPDIVATGDMESNGNTEFNATSSPYWKVYRNTKAPVGTAISNEDLATFNCQLYPNPNTGNFTLLFSDDITREVEVTDIAGQRVLSNLYVTRQAQIAMPQFAQGIYFVTIRENGLSKVMKVSVAR